MFLDCAGAILNGSWRFLSGVTVPGFGELTFGGLFINIFLVGLGLYILRKLM